MEYRKLGSSGLRVSELSLGTWVTFHKQLELPACKELTRTAIDAGVNFIDCAESYASGKAEELVGQVVKDYRREDLVLSTKLFWGGAGPNQEGLNRKHLLEGINNSLRRMGQDYVDLLFCHRPDPDTPVEETVIAMDIIVRSGKAFYWGTSEWPADKIEEAHRIAREMRAIPPSMEQPQYNMLHRARVENEYAPLYKKYGLGTTIWSPLASGVLTGKYNKGVPEGSRLAIEEWLQEACLSPERVKTVEELAAIAKNLDCSLAQLAIAWCLKNENVSTVILGASTPKQLTENLAAAEVKDLLNPEVMDEIGKIL